jgi:hypothetical protein
MMVRRRRAADADAEGALPIDDSPRGQVVDARLHVLDRQIVDRDGLPVCTVDDVDIAGLERGRYADGARDTGVLVAATPAGAEPTAAPRIAALLSGAVLWTRTFGGDPRLGHLARVPWGDVTDVDVVLTVARAAGGYEANWSENWVREQFIARIPGGHHAAD